MGKPLVATDVPGCRETIDRDVSGFLSEVRSAVSLEKAMVRMADLPAIERERMGAAGREKMRREFNVEIVIQRYLEMVTELSGP